MFRSWRLRPQWHLKKTRSIKQDVDGSACEFRAVHFRNKSNGGWIDRFHMIICRLINKIVPANRSFCRDWFYEVIGHPRHNHGTLNVRFFANYRITFKRRNESAASSIHCAFSLFTNMWACWSEKISPRKVKGHNEDAFSALMALLCKLLST